MSLTIFIHTYKVPFFVALARLGIKQKRPDLLKYCVNLGAFAAPRSRNKEHVRRGG